MPFSLNFYHDQVSADGATAPALPSGHRLLYVRHGWVAINGQVMSAGAAILRRTAGAEIEWRLERSLAMGACAAECGASSA
jgi:hypothetical protein